MRKKVVSSNPTATPVTNTDLSDAWDAAWRTLRDVVSEELSRMKEGASPVTSDNVSAVVSFLQITRERLNEVKAAEPSKAPWIMHPQGTDEPADPWSTADG